MKETKERNRGGKGDEKKQKDARVIVLTGGRKRR
jgi:hypothetical protein